MSTDDYIKLISTLGFPVIVALIMLIGVGYIVGWVIWPWGTKQYEAGRAERVAQTIAFNETLAKFDATLEKRDEQRHIQQQDFLAALNNQRFEFLQALAKRDDATINIVNALEELTKEVKALSKSRRGEG